MHRDCQPLIKTLPYVEICSWGALEESSMLDATDHWGPALSTTSLPFARVRRSQTETSLEAFAPQLIDLMHNHTATLCLALDEIRPATTGKTKWQGRHGFSNIPR